MSLVNPFRSLLSLCCWLVIDATSQAWGCPNCKEGLLENGQVGINLARGFELSIYLMLGAPLLILSTLGFVFYLQIRAAKRNGTYPNMAQIIAGVEAERSPASPI